MSDGRGRLEVPERPRPRLPPLTAALDSSDDSARYASREYRSRQAKRRRRAKQEAERTERVAPGDSADSATLRSVAPAELPRPGLSVLGDAMCVRDFGIHETIVCILTEHST